MRKWAGLVALCSVLMTVGCVAPFNAPVVPPVGAFFTKYDAPLTTEGVGQSVGTKQGKASMVNVLALVAFGDCSLDAAARDGNLSTIEYVDYSYLNVFGMFQSFTVIVHGN